MVKKITMCLLFITLLGRRPTMDTEDLDKEISDACDFMWPEKEGLSTRESVTQDYDHF